MRGSADRGGVGHDAPARRVERHTPDDEELCRHDRVPQPAEEARRHEVPGSIRRKRRAPTVPAEGVETVDPGSDAHECQSTGAPDPKRVGHGECQGKEPVGQPGQRDHEDGEEEPRVEEGLGPEQCGALGSARPDRALQSVSQAHAPPRSRRAGPERLCCGSPSERTARPSAAIDVG